MKAKFVVLKGAKNGSFVVKLPTVIGRSKEVKVKLPSSKVSRYHCEIYDHQGKIVAKDLNSSNGTMVNGVKIGGPTFLTPDDVLEVGPVRLKVLAHHPEEAAKAALADTVTDNSPRVKDTVSDEPVIAEARDESPQPDEKIETVTTPETAIAEPEPVEQLNDVTETVSAKPNEPSEEKRPEDDPFTPKEDFLADSSESVINVSESTQGSFIGIDEVEFGEAAPSQPSNSEVLGDLPTEEKEQVKPNDSALNSFFKNFE